MLMRHCSRWAGLFKGSTGRLGVGRLFEALHAEMSRLFDLCICSSGRMYYNVYKQIQKHSSFHIGDYSTRKGISMTQISPLLSDITL